MNIDKKQYQVGFKLFKLIRCWKLQKLFVFFNYLVFSLQIHQILFQDLQEFNVPVFLRPAHVFLKSLPSHIKHRGESAEIIVLFDVSF